ncbi:MAG: class I SAM-dependent methyltransferase [Anaerolineales bacterium]|nr:class I SAM-dependent methyltransferase [Anaerolineales bacterium]
MLGPTEGLHCLDIGSDNGVISYLLREQGGTWKSADLDEHSVNAIKALVGTEVYQIDDRHTPFADNEFDCVAVVDYLEHIQNDAAFINELYRILKPGGTLIINVPHVKNSLLRKFRLAIGQTDEKHGHLRPGYTVDSLNQLMEGQFTIKSHKTYSKFFSELVDTLIVFGVSLIQGNKSEKSQKGPLVTGKDLDKSKSMFKIYSLIYPFVLLISKLDNLLYFRSGYMLLLRTRVNKVPFRISSCPNINPQKILTLKN